MTHYSTHYAPDKEENLSPHDLEGKFLVALEKIGRATSPNLGERQKPIYQRAKLTKHKAIDEAAKALTVLWKIRMTAKP